jgi:hypothetical protein
MATGDVVGGVVLASGGRMASSVAMASGGRMASSVAMASGVGRQASAVAAPSGGRGGVGILVAAASGSWAAAASAAWPPGVCACAGLRLGRLECWCAAASSLGLCGFSGLAAWSLGLIV